MNSNRLLSAVGALLVVSIAAYSLQAQPAQTTQPKSTPAAKAPAKASATKAAATSNAPATAAKKFEIDPLDWPNWRGPEQDCVSRETGIIEKWDPEGGEGSGVLWKSAELGGISTPIVLRGKLYTIVRADPGTRHEGEKVVCVDAATGKKIWENRFNVYLSDVPAERVGWSSCVADPTTGRIYAQGVSGYFLCMDGDTGKTIWSRSMHEEFGLLSTYGGRTNIPVIFEDMVLISAVVTGWGEMARPTHRFWGLDKNTGDVIWFTGTRPAPEDTTYSTPALSVLGGQPALVFGSGDGGVWAFQPRTGKSIWNFQLSRRGLDASPIVQNDVVYMSHAQENVGDTTMGGVLAIDGRGAGDITKTGQLWKARSITSGKASPVLVDGRLYIAEESGRLHVFDAKTGKPIGKPNRLVGTIVRSSPLYVDGKIYLCSTSGYHVFQVTDDGLKPVVKQRLSEEDEVTSSFAVSHGRLYLTTGANLYCLGTADAKPQATELPKQPVEDKVVSSEPAHVQVVPCELLLSPDQKQQLKVRLFNDRGQFLKESAAEFTLQGPGEIDKSGLYTAASGTAHTGTIVTATVGKLTGQARIRVVPPLPWKFTFNDTPLSLTPATPTAPPPKQPEGEAPVTWVGARHRHKIRDVDGERVMVKVTTIPKGTRSQSWMGHSDLHDYTIQADVYGNIANDLVPDIGLIAQRYTLDMMGASQQLQIRSWTSQVATAFSKTIDFNWKPNVWYTMKFSASVEDGKAVLRGKVWPRDEKEPAAWTIEATDDSPNLTGSPGLFGNATNAEIYIDNVAVTANQ